MKAILAFLLALALSHAALARSPRHLVICVDGVGYETVATMRADARFSLFREPARMIATFPSLTDTSMTAILRPAGAGQSNGYEDRYFDLESNRVRGGLFDRFRQKQFVESGFRRLFDYHPSAIASGLAFAAPPLSAYAETLNEIAHVRRKFLATRDPVCFVYVGGTDTLAHLGGERMLRSALARLDAVVTKIVEESAAPVEVTIFSDHGNAFRKYERVSVDRALRRAGFRIAESLGGARDVVVPRFGLVAATMLFTSDENEPDVADACAAVRGVQFAAYEARGAAIVISRDGRARIERQAGGFRYVPETGDPLGLARFGSETLTDAEWFAATREGPYPDAVRRVFDGVAGDLVRNRASVIVSLDDGFYAGSRTLDLFAFMRAAHGNLGRGESLGFVASTSRDLAPYVRSADVWSAIGSPRLEASR